MLGLPKRGPLVHSSKETGRIVLFGATLAGILLLITIVLLSIGFSPAHNETVDSLLKAFAVFWAVAPPAWFWFEYYVLWDRNPATLDALKHGQALAAAIWLATLGIIAAYFKLILEQAKS